MSGKPKEITGSIGVERVLGRTGWLAEQPAGFQSRMMALARWRSFSAGQDLYTVEDAPNGVFGLERGRVTLSIPIAPDEMVKLWVARPGFWFGDSALLSDTTRGISVTARTECLVLAIPAADLRRHLAHHPEDMAYFFRLNHANTMLAIELLSEVIALPPRARFARFLLRLVSEEGDVEVTQSELGAMVGMSRAAFRRAFSELIEAGVVQTDYGVVRVLDRKALEQEAKAR